MESFVVYKHEKTPRDPLFGCGWKKCLFLFLLLGPSLLFWILAVLVLIYGDIWPNIIVALILLFIPPLFALYIHDIYSSYICIGTDEVVIIDFVLGFQCRRVCPIDSICSLEQISFETVSGDDIKNMWRMHLLKQRMYYVAKGNKNRYLFQFQVCPKAEEAAEYLRKRIKKE